VGTVSPETRTSGGLLSFALSSTSKGTKHFMPIHIARPGIPIVTRFGLAAYAILLTQDSIFEGEYAQRHYLVMKSEITERR